MYKVCVIAVLVGACGGGGGGTADAAMIDAVVTPDARSSDASIDGRPAVEEGQVFLGKLHDSTNASTSVVMAMFLHGPLYVITGSADGCDAIQDMPPSSLTAGSITVTGTTVDVTLAQGSPNAEYTPSSAAPNDLFAAGATLTVTTTGAVVPAFTGDVVGPPSLAGVVFPGSISRAAPATITWTAGTSDTMWFLVASADTTPGGMLCKAPDNGSFTLTTNAIGLLPPAVTKLTIAAYRMNDVPVTAGAWTVHVRAADGVLADPTPIGP